jgi:tripartite-type tricarboxylate transporter receptor subunit TctC
MDRDRVIVGGMLAALLCCGAMAPDAAAQSRYPTKPVTVVVPLQAGTASDLVMRVVGEKLGAALGQPVLVENVPGAGGAVGAARVAKAAPDGQMLGAFNNGVLTILPQMDARLPFDPSTDFVPITLLAGFPSVLIVPPDLPARTLQELFALARQSPGKLNYASVGSGSPQHLAMEMLISAAGVQLTHVPYKGGAQATLAIAAGEVQAFWIATSVALAQIRAGKVRALAVGETQRTAALPDVPTVREAGIAGYEYSPWLALYAPAGTPPDVVERLRADVTRILALPDVQERLRSQGLEPRASTGAELAALAREESVRTGAVIKRIGLKSQ